MTTHRQNSFIAELGSVDQPVNALDALLGHPATYTARIGGGGIISGAQRKIDDSHMLANQRITNPTAPSALTLYFRQTDCGYVMYVRTPGPHFGKGISLDSTGALGAFKSDVQSPTHFVLLTREGKQVTLEDLDSDTSDIQLRALGTQQRVMRQRKNHSPYIYLACRDTDQQAFVFPLTIKERNAPYLSEPNEV